MVFSCVASRNKQREGYLKVEAANKTPCGRAPGYRYRDTGALGSVGSSGCNWASTVSSIHGMYLGFDVTNLGPSSAYSRSYGFQLRCLSE